jgi:transposase
MVDLIETYLGLDLAKKFVDVCALCADGTLLWQQRIPRTAAALVALVKRLENRRTLAVMEATGGLEDLPARALEACGVGVSVQNPAKMRHFALSRGLLEKSDKIDARTQAEFGRERRLQPRTPPDPACERLAALTTRRRQLVGLRAAEKTRLRGETIEFTRQSLLRVIEQLGAEIKLIEEEIQLQLRASRRLWESYKLLLTAPGVGATTAAELVAMIPELGELSRGEAAKLAGLAPLLRQSGSFRGQAKIMGGRGPLRSALYMAALTASRHNVWFRDRYQQMVDRGKAKKLTLIALARQLLAVLNQMVRHGRSFDLALLPALAPSKSSATA